MIMISGVLIIRSIRTRVPFYTKPVLIKKKLVTVGSYPTVYVRKSTRCYGPGYKSEPRCVIGSIAFEQCIECFNIAPTAFLTFHRRCNNRKINSLRLHTALINVVHRLTSGFYFFQLSVIFSS